MKKLALFALVLLVFPAAFLGQNKEMKKLYNKYQEVEGFSLKIEETDIQLDMDGDFSRWISELDEVYILKFDHEKGAAADRKEFESKLMKLCNKHGFHSMFDIESENSIKMLSAKNKSEVTTDYLLITRGDEESLFLWATSN